MMWPWAHVGGVFFTFYQRRNGSDLHFQKNPLAALGRMGRKRKDWRQQLE